MAIKVFTAFFLCFIGISGVSADPPILHLLPQPPLVAIKATILDIKSRPIAGAYFDTYNSNHDHIEDPDEVWRASDDKGKVSYYVPASGIYYIQAGAIGYLPSQVRKVVSTANVISVTFKLKRAPLPPYPITTLHATFVNQYRRPIGGVSCDIYSASGQGLVNLLGSPDLLSDTHGHLEETVRAGGVLTVHVQGDGYYPLEKKVRAKPGVIPLVFVLKRNGEPLSVLKDVSR